MDIIQHHKPIDFETLFKQLETATIGIDGRDWETFTTGAAEIHSFFGRAELKDRIENALGIAIGSDEAVEIINKSKTFMLIIKNNPNCERALTVEEMSAINKFMTGLPDDCDIRWSLMQDSTIGNKVEVIFLCNIKK